MADWRFILYLVFFIGVNAVRVGFLLIRYYLHGGREPFEIGEAGRIIFRGAIRDAHNLRFRRWHLFVEKEAGKYKIAVLGHDDYIRLAQKKINSTAKTAGGRTLIRESLTEALGGATFIIFSDKKSELKFIQFWTADKQLLFNFTATRKNKSGKYYLDIISLLEEMGYKKDDPDRREKNEYTLKTAKGEIEINVNMGKDIARATELTYRIFKDIYGVKRIKVRVE